MDDPAKPVSDSMPFWHNPDLPTSPVAPVSLPPIPKTPAGPAEPPLPPIPEPLPPPLPPVPEPVVPPPPPPPPPPATVVKLPRRKSAAKPILLGLIFLLIAVSGVLGYTMLQQEGLPFNLGKKAATEGEICREYPEACPEGGIKKCYEKIVNGQCVYDRCDECKICGDGPCDYGEGPDNCPADCGGGGGTPPLDCEGKPYRCEGQSNNDGSVGVRNCSNGTQFYTCQKESDRFTSVEACQTPVRTTQGNISYSGMKVEPNEVGICSTDAGGSCNLGQADILQQGSSSGICWDIKRDCSNCGAPTNTPTPIPTLTPVPISGTPIPILTACTGLQVYKEMVAPQGETASSESPATTWQVGDRMVIRVSFTGVIEDVGVRILRNGTKVLDVTREGQSPGSQNNPWATRHTITEPGDYEVQAFVKFGGNWK